MIKKGYLILLRYKQVDYFQYYIRNMQLELSKNQSRYREFSEIRQEKSQRIAHSRSHYNDPNTNNRSLNHSFIKKLDYEQKPKNKQSRNSLIQPNSKKSDIREPNQSKSYRDLGESRKTKNGISKSSKLLCVGCFNKQMCAHKAKRHQAEFQIQKSRYSKNCNLINENDSYHKLMRSRYDDQYKKTKEYNLNKIKEHQKAKQQMERAKEKRIKDAQLALEQNKKAQKDKEKVLAQKRMQLRRELEQQIEDRRKRRIDDSKMDQSSFIYETLMGTKESGREAERQKMQENYRKQLLEQINEHKQKMQGEKREDYRRKRQEQLEIMNKAAEDAKKRKEQIDNMKAMKEKEEKLLAAHKQQKQAQQRRRIADEEKQRIAEAQFQAKQFQRREELKKQQLDRYLGDLKTQMEFNKKKKEEEYHYLHEPSNAYIFAEKKSALQRQCDSCEKRFPESYLSRFNESNYESYQ